MLQKRSLKIAIIAGEASGDILGAELIYSLQKQHSNINVEGVVGPKMIAAGCLPLYPSEKLSVMGIIDPLKHLPEILKMQRALIRHFIHKNRPDILIGIDSPDFNLTVELKCKQAGISTVHYVSPSVWAWRKWRINKIKKAVDLMLTLFPFEVDFYQKHSVLAKHVGHPLADTIPLEPDQNTAREKLNLPANKKILAILPGSRASEIEHLAPSFIQTAAWCTKHLPELQVITAMYNSQRKKQFYDILQKTAKDLPIEIFAEKSQDVMLAADAVLLASGTVTLEAMLLKRPMVVAYRVSFMNYLIAKALINVNYFSLPNLIAGKRLIPEFFQKQAVPEIMGPALLEQLKGGEQIQQLLDAYKETHRSLKCNASEKAATAILELLEKKEKAK